MISTGGTLDFSNSVTQTGFHLLDLMKNVSFSIDTKAVTTVQSVNLDEEFLVQSLKQHDDAAVRQFVKKYQESIFRLCASVLYNHEDAEDLTQESLMSALQHIQDFNGKSKFSTWLYRIAMNHCLQHIRAKKRQKRFAVVLSLFGSDESDEPLPIEDESQQIENAYIRSDTLKTIKAAIKKLPAQQQLAFSFIYLNDYSYQETADIMNTSVKAVESLLSRAKNKLQIELEGL